MRQLKFETPEVFLPLLESDARYKGAVGGRGSGKSRFWVDTLIEDCVINPGTSALCIREFQTSLRQSVKKAVEMRIHQLGLRDYFECQNAVTKTYGGGEIVYQGMQNHNSDSVKSFENFRRALIEEGQSLSKRSWNLLYPTIRAPGSQIWVAWNRNKPTDAVDEFFREAQKAKRKDVISVEANYWDNPFFPDELRADMEFDKRRDPELYAHIWCGKYATKSAAQVFKHGVHWRVGSYEEFEGLGHLRPYYGGDFGFASDPSVLIEGRIQGRSLYLTAEAYEVGCEIDHLPFLFAGTEDEELVKKNRVGFEASSFEQRQRWKGISGCRHWPITADSARPETISYLRRHGFPKIVPAIKGAKSVEEGVKFIQSYNVIIHPDCKHTIDEFTHYAYKIDQKTEEVLPVLEDRKNHVIDSVRYMLEKLRKAKMGIH